MVDGGDSARDGAGDDHTAVPHYLELYPNFEHEKRLKAAEMGKTKTRPGNTESEMDTAMLAEMSGGKSTKHRAGRAAAGGAAHVRSLDVGAGPGARRRNPAGPSSSRQNAVGSVTQGKSKALRERTKFEQNARGPRTHRSAPIK